MRLPSASSGPNSSRCGLISMSNAHADPSRPRWGARRGFCVVGLRVSREIWVSNSARSCSLKWRGGAKKCIGCAQAENAAIIERWTLRLVPWKTKSLGTRGAVIFREHGPRAWDSRRGCSFKGSRPRFAEKPPTATFHFSSPNASIGTIPDPGAR